VFRTFSVDREAALAACSQAYYGHGKLEVLPMSAILACTATPAISLTAEEWNTAGSSRLRVPHLLLFQH
jgi:hypothetical protein